MKDGSDQGDGASAELRFDQLFILFRGPGEAVGDPFGGRIRWLEFGDDDDRGFVADVFDVFNQ